MKAKRSKGSGLEQACSPRNSLVYFPWGCIINRLGLDLEGFFIWLDPEEFFITWLDCPVMWPGLTLQFQKSQLFKWWGLHMRRLKKTARSVSFNFRGKSRGSVSRNPLHIRGFRWFPVHCPFNQWGKMSWCWWFCWGLWDSSPKVLQKEPGYGDLGTP